MNSREINPWNYKPWWCQPWSILLTGIIVIGSSWVLTQFVWLTVLVGIPVVIWWCYFLVIWPKLVRDYYRSKGKE